MQCKADTNQLQHPQAAIRTLIAVAGSTYKSSKTVLMKPSSVHSTHTHFYQTNYCRGPFETRDESLFLYSATRPAGSCSVQLSVHLFTTPFNSFSLYSYMIFTVIKSNSWIICVAITAKVSND